MNKEPLKIFVLWHKDFQLGYKYAKEIFTRFSRDIDNPFSQSIGIPVYFVTNITTYKFERVINSARQEAFILLVDMNMTADEVWQKNIESIISACNSNKDSLIFPVEMDDTSFNFSQRLTNKNFIRLKNVGSQELQMNKLIYLIAHELCRMLYDMSRISDAEINNTSCAPIKLFLSHAKYDGQYMANDINNFIHENTPLKTFFDSNDIAPGFDFSNEIIENIQSSVILAIHTDSYSSRDWCQREILIAKKNNRPIIVADILEKGENRSFPYMANIRVIRVYPTMDISEIITEVLLETLKLKYHEEYILYLKDIFDVSVDSEDILFYPPELFTLLYLSKVNPELVVYPDPPLNDNEIEILHKFMPSTQFVTPLMLPSLNKGSYILDCLNGAEITISISESEDIIENGFMGIHLNTAAIEISRYMLACDAKLVYCGNIDYHQGSNYLKLLCEVARNYHYNNNGPKHRITNYYSSSFPISIEQQAKFKDCVAFVETHLTQENKWDPRIIKASNLSNTRRVAIQVAKACIFIGGKTKGFQGKYPGIIEESYIALQNNKPIYLIGAFGGATKCIIECIQGKSPYKLTKEFHFMDDDYEEFYDEYNKYAKDNYVESISFENISQYFNNIGIDGLNNGLSKEENEILFFIDNMSEAIALILKGLVNIHVNENHNSTIIDSEKYN